MTPPRDDSEKWKRLQEYAKKSAKEEVLEALLLATGLGEYIAKAIEKHERQMHNED